MNESKSSIKYTCGMCGDEVPAKEDLVAKRVQFREMGPSGKVLRTRVVAWICKKRCIDRDPDYRRPAYEASPGTSAKREG